MKKIGIGVGILLILFVGTALVAPGFIDWNQYKTQIETTASDLSDRKVAINGDLSLTILPSPSFSAEDVSVSNVQGGQATNFISLKSVDVNVAFFPLLRGEIQVKKFILIEPVIALELDANGKGNWEFGSADETTDTSGTTTSLSFEQFQIENGQLSYQDFSTGMQELVRGINASVSMDSLQGPFDVTGSARYKNLPVSAELMVGMIREGRKIPIGLKAGLLNDRVRIDFSGGFLPDDVSPQADGKINLQAKDIGDLLLAASLLDLENTSQNGPTYNHPLSLDTTVAYGGDAINISTLEFELGESRGAGNMTATFGELTRFNGNLTVNSFNLDSFLPALDEKNAVPSATVNPGRETDYSILENLEGNFKLTLGALQYNEKIASQMALDITANNGEIAFTDARLNMPGGSELTMNGALSAPGNKPVLGGDITLNSGNMRAFLEWLKVDVTMVPEGRLTRLEYKSEIQATEEMVQLYGIAGHLDTFQFSGGVSYALQERPSMGVDVALQNLNIDNYLIPSEEDADYKQALAILADFDANYKVEMTNVTMGGIAIKKFGIDGELFGGNLNAKTINVEDYAGFDLNGSLIGSNLASSPRFETSFNTTAASLVPLQRAFRFTTPYNIAEVGAVAVNARLTGDFEKVNVDVKSTVGSSKADITGEVRSATLKQLPEIGSVDLNVTASNSSLASLIDQFDLPLVKPQVGDDRPFALVTSLKGTQELVDIDGNVTIAGGAVSLKGRANLIENELGNFDMAVDVNGPDVREFVRGLGVDFRPSKNQLGPLALKMAASGNSSDVSLKNIVGTVGPTKFTGSGDIKGLNAVLEQGQKSNFDFTLVLDDVPVAEFMEASAEVPEDQEWGNWSSEPMELAVLNNYDGRATITANRINYEKYDFKNPRFEAVLKDGVININNFTGKLFGGDVAIAGTFNSVGELNMDVSLKNAAIVEATSSFAGIKPVKGYFDMTQNITGKGTSQEALISSLNGLGAVTASSGIISGIDVPRLSERLNGLKNQNGLLGLLTSTLSGGETPYNGGSSSVTMQNGFIQLSPFDVKMLGAKSDIDMGINLAQWKMNLTGDMSLSDHPTAPPIGINIAGALHDPKIDYNTKPLEGFIGKKIAASLLQNMVEGNGGIGDLFGGVGEPAHTPDVPATTQPSPPINSSDTVTTTPLEDFIDPTVNDTKPVPQEAPADQNKPDSVEELGTRLLERLFQKPPPQN